MNASQIIADAKESGAAFVVGIFGFEVTVCGDGDGGILVEARDESWVERFHATDDPAEMIAEIIETVGTALREQTINECREAIDKL